jgi:Tol biopolymer transport system component
VRDGLLFAQSFDDRTLILSGEPRHIADRVGSYVGSYGYAAVDAAADGTVVVGPVLAAKSRLQWLDRHGRVLGTGPSGVFSSPRLAGDQRRVAIAVRDEQRTEHGVSLFDLGRATFSKVTTHPSSNWFPAWMPNGGQILFASTRDASRAGAQVIYRKSATGMDDDEPLHVKSPVVGLPNDVSADMQFVLAHNLSSRGYDLSAYRLAADEPASDVLATPFNELQGRFSPNGRWVAYASDETGRFEV